ncbi:hypothetical protein EVAR_50129_1 [Eumeta japonica]|uniref:Uncharacterized protein n=1 Tax=Eumeta variegata TaxID=151549 RepID=A0A4C1YPJ5_EUMVA|nr:hypothetical protein EVAR_50129_1 [Eumeta japonica]
MYKCEATTVSSPDTCEMVEYFEISFIVANVHSYIYELDDGPRPRAKKTDSFWKKAESAEPRPTATVATMRRRHCHLRPPVQASTKAFDA